MPKGGKREGAGRPFGAKSVTEENALSVQVAVRLTANEKAELESRKKQGADCEQVYTQPALPRTVLNPKACDTVLVRDSETSSE